MPDQIKAVRCHRYSGLDDSGKPVPTPDPLRDVLTLDDIPRPECEEGAVVVLTHYAGVQYPDTLQAQGLYQHKPDLPYIPGMDVTGTVLETGAGVSQVGVGDRVIAQMSTGGLAEIVCVPAESVWKAPDNVHLSKCANIGRNFFAAYHSLRVLGDVGRATSCWSTARRVVWAWPRSSWPRRWGRWSSQASVCPRRPLYRRRPVPTGCCATAETGTATGRSRARSSAPPPSWTIPRA